MFLPTAALEVEGRQTGKIRDLANLTGRLGGPGQTFLDPQQIVKANVSSLLHENLLYFLRAGSGPGFLLTLVKVNFIA